MALLSYAAGDVIAGKYRVIGVLGQGGMGCVYDAVIDAIGKRVALKLLNPDLAEDPEFAHRFAMEARAAALINHPGIVDVLDSGQDEDGAPYIVMEHLQGLTAKALCAARGLLSPAQASAVAAPVLEALEAAHAAGIVHRDLKPANVFLTVRPARGVKVLDFGISKFASEGTGMTKTGATLGTPAFMAPEQLRQGRAAGTPSDLYAVGAVLFNLVTGRAPYEAESDYVLIAQILTTDHPPALVARPDLPPAFAQFVDQLLSKEPSARPPDAKSARARLLELAPPDPDSVFAAAAAATPETTPIPAPGAEQPLGPSTRGGRLRTSRAATSLPAPRPGRFRRVAPAAGVVALAVAAAAAGLASWRPAPTLEEQQAAMLAESGKAGEPGRTEAPNPAGITAETFQPVLEKVRTLKGEGKEAEALELLDQELRKAEPLPDRRAEAYAARNRGNFAKDLGRCAEAASYLLRSVKLLEGVGDRAGVGVVANDLGLLGFECPEIDRIAWFKLAVKARWEVRSLEGVRRSANNLGVAYLKAADFESADRAYDEALIAATELKDAQAIMKIRANKAMVAMLVAAGSTFALDPSQVVIDKDSAAYKRAKENFGQSVAKAKELGLSEQEVCELWGNRKALCLALAE